MSEVRLTRRRSVEKALFRADVARRAADDGTTPVPIKKALAALERVFAAEIAAQLPFQSKAAIYKDLLAAGLVAQMARRVGTALGSITVSGYELTHAGRLFYCSSC